LVFAAQRRFRCGWQDKEKKNKNERSQATKKNKKETSEQEKQKRGRANGKGEQQQTCMEKSTLKGYGGRGGGRKTKAKRGVEGRWEVKEGRVRETRRD